MISMKKYLYIVLLVFFWSCEDGADGITGQDGQDGLSTILYTLDEPSGDNCANGGTKIVYGIDVNSDGVLSDSEIDNSTYICNGTDGQDAEVETEESLSPVGVWYQEGYGTITGTLNDNNGVLYDTTYDNTNDYLDERRLIITNEFYFHFSRQDNDVVGGNFEWVTQEGNCMIVDNLILVFDDNGEIISTNNGTIVTGEWHYEIYESGSKLKLSRAQFEGDLNINQSVPYETKPLYTFHRQ